VNPQRKFHLVFSFVMGAMMISLMTLVITAVNVGFTAEFLTRWGRSFAIGYVIGVPMIFFLAPVARKITSRLIDMPA
jgi:hypothetical protein